MGTKRFLKIFCLVLAAVVFGGLSAQALPEVDEVVYGKVSIETVGDTMTFNVDSNKAIINLRSFDIGTHETVIFSGPSSEVLARINGGAPSAIQGHLFSDLRMLALINEAGISITGTGHIDARNLVLSTRDITDVNFMNSDYMFEKMNREIQDLMLLNEGKITIHDGGFGVLIAGAVENRGVISAPAGTIVIAGCDALKLDIILTESLCYIFVKIVE